LVTPDDHITYIFNLRKDIFWHAPAVDFTDERYAWLQGDHKVTAQDVVFMMDLLLNEQVSGAAPLRSYYEGVDSYRAVDEYTFEIKFKERKFAQYLALQDLYPIPRFLYEFDEDGEKYDAAILGQRFQDHWYNPRAIGCGPYRFVRYEAGVVIELERDPRHPVGGNAHDKIVISILRDQSSWPRKLRTGELHLSQLQPGQYRSEVLIGEPDSPFKDGTLQSGEFWTHSYFYIGWNADKPWFGDKRVRWAMSHAFNAELLLREVFMDLGVRSTGPMPNFLPFYDQSIPEVPFDLGRAAELLDEAGWVDSNGNGIRDKTIDGSLQEFEFALMVYGSSDEYKTVGNIFKEDLAKIGVVMTVRPMDWANLLKKVDDRDFDAVTLAWVLSPQVDFHQIWHSSQADVPKGSNRVGFRNAEADVIIEKLQKEFDYDERVRLAHAFHKLTYDEQPYTFFYNRKRKVFWQPELKNVQFSQTRPYMNPRPWFLATTTQP
jgi:ABC-type transport system substrate-binding protein